MANLEERYRIQREAIGESTADNPHLPEGGSPVNRKALKTERKIVTLAINELQDRILAIRDSTLESVNTLLEQVIGNIVDQKDLLDKLRSIDNNLIGAVYKVYTFIVGNPEEPTDISDISDSVNGAIRSLNDDLGELRESTGKWNTKEW